MRLFVLFLGWMFLGALPAQAQYAAQQDAEYIATLKAVVNYKIDDEEELRNVERLRENEAFNRQLQRMMGKLQNTRTKNSKNQRVLQILKQAGKEIYDILK